MSATQMTHTPAGQLLCRPANEMQSTWVSMFATGNYKALSMYLLLIDSSHLPYVGLPYSSCSRTAYRNLGNTAHLP